jgi:hypothetical protein
MVTLKILNKTAMGTPSITLSIYRNQVALARLDGYSGLLLGPPRWRVNVEKEFP